MLEKKQFIEEFGADVYTYDVNGLCVIFVDKECDEFAFNATVDNKNISNDGLPHMVEHCVFGGSSNYNIDEPFEYLVKTKKYKYLNAITYRDRTVFPFSTYDINDFDEILDVYLDAIFNANMSNETFEQECVRVDDGEYNGIILNEMMEMYADDLYRHECEILSKLNDDIFKFNSAGEPNAIKTVEHDNVIKYYDDNYTVNNTVISFYGKFEHTKYIELILEKISNSKGRCLNDKTHSSEGTANNFININEVHLKGETSIVITSKTDNVIYENEIDLFLQCLVLSNEDKIINLLKKEYNIKNFTCSINNDLNIKYLIVTINYTSIDDECITCKTFIEILEQILQQYTYEELDKELYKKSFIYKNEDFGYKTQGIYTLLEISKIGKGVYTYYKSIDKNIARLPLKYEVNSNDVHFVHVFNVFEEKLTQYNHGKNSINNAYLVYRKKSEKNINNLFFYSTNYDIINTIIVINLKHLIHINGKILDYVHIDENVFKQLDFVMNTYTSRVTLNKLDLDGFYINITVFTNDIKNMLSNLNEFLKNLKVGLLLQVTNDKNIEKINNSFKVQDIINCITKDTFDAETQQSKTISINETNTIKPVEFKIFKMNEDSIVHISNVINENFLDNLSPLLHINNLQGNRWIKEQVRQQVRQQINKVPQNELYKNFLVIDIQPFVNNMNDCAYDIDYMYIELVLEALVNEKLLEKIRFKNGAYEVNYKLLKLENKVVLYSNIDRNSKTTLDIFKMELKSLNNDYLSNIENYLNKITNNFYRNEQNKNIKTKKQFDNWLLNIHDSLTEFDFNKVEQAMYILKNAEIVGEFSFGKTNYKNYKDGGTYVY